MAVTPDQRALLRLLLSGDTYERVAEVLGISPNEVRARAHDAAADLETAKDDELSAEAVRRRLKELDEPSTGAEPVPAGVAATPRRTDRPWALWIAAAGVAIAAIVVLLVVIGGGSGDDGSTTSTRGDQENIVPIKLTPVGQSKASGGFSVVRVADQPAVDLAIAGLEPSGRGESYVLWFVGSGGRSLPVAFRSVGTDGKLTGRASIPSAAEGLLPSFDTAQLTLSRQQEAAAAVQRAAQSATLPQVVGTPVMRGSLR
jgi:DNA-binding CsgD family transcriptional regulator